MRYPIMLGALAFVMFFGIGKSSAAAWDNPPGGSYQSSCKNIKVRGDSLFARCKNNKNHWVDTSLADYDRCRGDISNTGGQLTCGGGQGGSGGSYPTGTYTQTCRDISVRGNRSAPAAKMAMVNGLTLIWILTAAAEMASAISTDSFAASAMDTEMATGAVIVAADLVVPIARPAATSMFGVIRSRLNARMVMANGAGPHSTTMTTVLEKS